jgi:UMF1 family MFS transporter
MRKISGAAWRWALYDWANSVFATTVLAAFFPLFFSEYWGSTLSSVDAIFWLGLGTSIAGILAAICGPLIGSISDRSPHKTWLLGILAFTGAGATAALAAIGAGGWAIALTAFITANVCFLLSIVVADSLLTEVSTPKNVDFISGFAFGLGYLGGGILFVGNVIMVLNPGWFGLPDAASATRVAFLTVGIWWAVFTIPIITLKLKNPAATPILTAVREGASDLFKVGREIITSRQAILFLLAYWFYIDGVDTLIAMSVAYGKGLGVESEKLIITIVIIQFVAFPSALVTGWLGQKFGPKPVLMAGVLIYLGITYYASHLTLEPLQIGFLAIDKIYLLGIMIAMVQGGVQSLSRSLFTRLIPEGKSGAWFGFYNLLGRFAAILGPFLMAIITKTTAEPRLGILSVSILFLLGAILLSQVRIPNERHT